MKKCVSCQTAFESAAWTCPSCGYGPAIRDGVPVFSPALAESAASYDTERHALVEQAEQDHFWFRTRADVLVWVLRRFFPDAQKYLEVGCGTGFLMQRLGQAMPAVEIVGSDLLLSGIQRTARRLPGCQLLQMDALNIPFREEFSVIGAFDVIEHIEDDLGVMREFRDALQPGGGLVLTVPQYASLWSEHDERARHVRRYSSAGFRSRAREAGFEVEYLGSLFASTLPLLWLSRRAIRSRRRESGEFRPAGIVNRALGAMLAGETTLVRAGWRLPFGSSLLMVARSARA